MRCKSVKMWSTDDTKQTLNKLSSLSFFLSFLAAKIQYIPVVNMGAAFLNLFSFSFNLLAYSLWYVASYFYPEQYPRNKDWYSFASFKEQQSYAALLGIAAAILSIAALSNPILAIPAAWIFFTSSLYWVVSEYHKFNNPPPDKEYSESKQTSNLSYAVIVTTLSFVNAATSTLVLYFPLLVIPILAISGLINIGLSLVALEYFLDVNFSEHKKIPISDTSYHSMSNGLGSTMKPEHKNSIDLMPHQGPNQLFKACSPKANDPELTPVESTSYAL